MGLTDDQHMAVCGHSTGGCSLPALGHLGGPWGCQVVHAGQHLGHDAALHFALGRLPLPSDRVYLICEKAVLKCSFIQSLWKWAAGARFMLLKYDTLEVDMQILGVSKGRGNHR